MPKKSKPRPAAAPESRVPAWLAAVASLFFIGLCLKLNNGFLRASWPEIDANVFPPLGRMTGAAFAAHLVALSEAAGLSAAFCGLGRVLIDRLGLETNDSWELWSLSFGLGLGAWGAGIFFLGMAGLLYPSLLIALTVASALPLLRKSRGPAAAEKSAAKTPLSPIGKACAAFFALLLLISLPNVLVPETFYDALMYHLALPEIYLRHHRLVPTPYNLFAGIPSLPQMVFAAALAWDRGTVAARLVHFSVIPALAASYMAAARRWERPDAGPLAACLFLGAPIALFELGRVTVGAELALFQFLSFYGFVVACGKEPPARRRWFVLSGLFLGFALSSKYTSWALPAAFLAAWAAAAWRRAGWAPRARELAAVFLVAAAVTAPWIVRNAAFYRDPLYPYLTKAFHVENAEYIQMDRQRTEAMGQSPLRILTEPDKLKAYLRLPWDMSLNFGLNNVEYPGPAFLMLLPALLLVPLSGPIALLSILAAGAWASLGLLTFLPRFFIPNLAVLALPLAWTACSLKPRWLQACAAAAVLATAAANALPLYVMAGRGASWPAFLGERTRDHFLAHGNDQGYVTPSYAGFRYIDAHAAPDAKVLLFGDGRALYSSRDSFGSTVYNASPLEVWANAAADAAALRDKLSAEGIAYLLVNRAEAVRDKNPLFFTARGREVFDAFWKRYLLKEYEVGATGDRWLMVYRVLDEAEAARPHPTYDPLHSPTFTAETAPPVGDD